MYNILKKWNIDAPEDCGSGMRYLSDNNPDKVFALDELPLTVSGENNDKYAQFELIFQVAKRNKQLLKKFVLKEDKYINVFTKLWLYNKFYASAYLCDYLRGDSKYRKYYKDLQLRVGESGLLEVTDKIELDYLVRINTREIANVSFYCEEYELIIVSSFGEYFLVYFNDLSHFDKVKSIAESEGLFLR